MPKIEDTDTEVVALRNLIKIKDFDQQELTFMKFMAFDGSSFNNPFESKWLP
jgi:hypothetical protein